MDAELALRDAELREVGSRVQEVTTSIAVRDRSLEEIETAQRDRRRWLAFRLRESYKGGAEQPLRRLLSGREADAYWQGLNYAALLSARDGRVLQAWRQDAQRSVVQRGELREARERLTALDSELARSRAALAASRSARAANLAAIRKDMSRQRALLAEIEQAGREMTSLAGSVAGAADATRTATDIRRLAGQLDWPAVGRVSAGFGVQTHARFKTDVPHPGWDIEAPAGAEIRAVLDGTVAFADWMRGYGLTAIVDHGGGLLSVYAHAAALAVARGDQVARGKVVGLVGDTGSLSGPFLYFELRLDGKPVDPAEWLRRR
jgi:septal ring factor EnvC (AmiA/AmiB activator)